jgi:hypothetical protein
VLGFGLLGGSLAFFVSLSPREFYLYERELIARQTGFGRLLRIPAHQVTLTSEKVQPDVFRVAVHDRRTNAIVLVAWLRSAAVEAITEHVRNAD